MKTHRYLAIFLIATSIAIGTVSIASPALADPSSGSNGLEKADDNVHENAPDNDVKFHEGTCQGGHTTEALENLGGCDILSDPGKSDGKRNDN